MGKFTMLFTTLLALIFTTNVQQSTEAAKMSGFNLKSGDVLITSNTSSKGLTGHAGIVAKDGKTVVSIHPKHNKGKAEYMSASSWLKSNPKTKVVRYKNSTKANKAGTYAWDNYIKGKYKNKTYKITPGVENTSYLYCSEIVWQSYKFGTAVNYKVLTSSMVSFGTPGTIQPYDYISSVNLKQNGFSVAKTYKW